MMNSGIHAFRRTMKNPVKHRLFLLTKLPSAFFSGVRVRDITEKECRVTVPYKWFSQNPFRSTYFACLSMAAEMSTGALAMAHLYRLHPPVSMLVIKMESLFLKKATGRTSFVCRDGELLQEAIRQAIHTGEAVTVITRAEGTSASGEKLAEFAFTWSFKVKAKTA